MAHAVIYLGHNCDVAVIVFLCIFKLRAHPFLFSKPGLFSVAFPRILATLLDGWGPREYNKAQRMNSSVGCESDARKRDCMLIKGVSVSEGFMYFFIVYLFVCFIYAFDSKKY